METDLLKRKSDANAKMSKEAEVGPRVWDLRFGV